MPKRIPCTVAGHEGEWIERVDRVPLKFWKAWKAADEDATQELFKTFLTAWNLTDVDGNPVPQPTEGVSALECIDLTMLPWLVHAITVSLFDDLRLPPNASSASPSS